MTGRASCLEDRGVKRPPPQNRSTPMSDKPISPLRRRMIEDMTVRNFVEKTHNDYIRHGYTHRVAISNSRLIAADATGVTFSYKDYRIEGPGRYKTMTLKPDEFIRRFLMHVLPNGFHRIRHCGLLASGTKTETIARIRELIAAVAPVQTAHQPQPPDRTAATDQATHPCPCCGGRMNIIETFKRGSTPHHRPTGPIIAVRIDTS